MEDTCLKVYDHVKILGVVTSGVGSEDNVGGKGILTNFDDDPTQAPNLIVFPANDMADLLEYYIVEKIKTVEDDISDYI